MIVDTAPELNEVLDRVSDDDRAWFDANPKRSHRWRFPIKGECRATFGIDDCHSIVVRQVQPGLRMRRPVFVTDRELELLDIEPVAHALFDLAASKRAGFVSLGEFREIAMSYCNPGVA